MPKKVPATTPLVAKHHSLAGRALRSTARLGATLVATRVAAATGKKGAVGIVAGIGAKRLIMRFPAGALFVTGAYMAGKLYEAKREMDRKKAIKALPAPDDFPSDKAPVPIEDARRKRAS